MHAAEHEPAWSTAAPLFPSAGGCRAGLVCQAQPKLNSTGPNADGGVQQGLQLWPLGEVAA